MHSDVIGKYDMRVSNALNGKHKPSKFEWKHSLPKGKCNETRNLKVSTHVRGHFTHKASAPYLKHVGLEDTRTVRQHSTPRIQQIEQQ